MIAPADRRDGSPREVIVLAGGEGGIPTRPLPADAIVIAADGGLRLASELGLQADVVAGDLDSVDRGQLERARAAGARVDRHPVDKDQTDLAIALDLALAHAPVRVTVIGGHGGRLDHHLANLLLLASATYADLEITAYMGTATVTVVRDRRTIHGRPGDLVSLLPLHGPASGVTTRGLRFALDDEVLHAGSSRGVSNVLTADQATIRLAKGILVAIQPGRPDDH